jgi:hypothetical protein
MTKPSSGSCLLIFAGAWMMVIFVFNTDFGFSHVWTKKTFPSGEIVTNEYSSHEAWQDGPGRQNQLYYQENASAWREPILSGPVHGPQLPVNDAKLIKYKGRSVLLVLHEHIFRYTVSNGKLGWMEMGSQLGDGAREFLASFFGPNNQPYPIPLADRNYWFDHVDFGRGLLATKLHARFDRLPLYLVYSTAAFVFPEEVDPDSSDYGWGFDLEQTRAANGIPAPDSSGFVVDVSIRGLSPPSMVSTDEIAASPPPSGKELYGQTLPVSSIKWTRMDFVPEKLAGEIRSTAGQDEFLFGYPDTTAADSYVMCWRGDDAYGTKYASVKLGEWYSSQGSFMEEMIFFRLRKQAK